MLEDCCTGVGGVELMLYRARKVSVSFDATSTEKKAYAPELENAVPPTVRLVTSRFVQFTLVMFAVVKDVVPLLCSVLAVTPPVTVTLPEAVTLPLTAALPLTVALPVTNMPVGKLTDAVVSEVIVSALSSDIVALFFDV